MQPKTTHNYKMISVDKCIPNQQISHHDNVNINFSIKQFILHFKSFQKISKQVKTNPKPILREISKQHILPKIVLI